LKDQLKRVMRIERALSSMVRMRENRLLRLEAQKYTLTGDIRRIHDVLQSPLVSSLPTIRQSARRIASMEDQMKDVTNDILIQRRSLSQCKSSLNLLEDRAAELEANIERDKLLNDVLERAALQIRSSFPQDTGD